MRSLLEYLSSEATVIIDAPPLLPVTDGAVLTHQADGALLVVTAGKTTYDLAAKAFGALESARGRALGMVINKAPMRGADASPYAYDYYTYYSHNDPAGSPAAAAASTSAPVVPAEHVADDPFAHADVAFDQHAHEDDELHLDDVLTPLLEDDPTPRTVRDRSRRS
jgi:Mrp family chromosome partitioning ATPase